MSGRRGGKTWSASELKKRGWNNDLIRELLEPEFGSLYVTPPNIDEMVSGLSFTISEGIHQAVFEVVKA